VDAHVKAGLLALLAHARAEGGWSIRRAAATLGVDHARLLRWQGRAALGHLDDAKPGPLEAPHALLDSERVAIVKTGIRSSLSGTTPWASSSRSTSSSRCSLPSATSARVNATST
jgi:hypothetical protein